MATIASDSIFYYFLFVIWFITAFLVHSFIKTCIKPTRPQAPPSPRALPIIGHLHLLGSVLPVSFQELARRHGPLMQLRLGAATCVVASNADVAKEIFKTQELNFSSRPEFGSSEYFIYRGSRFVTAQYGDYWRFMKKLCMTRLLAVPQLDRSVEIREQEVGKLMARVKTSALEGKPSDLSSELTTLTNNIICRMAMSTRCSETDDEAKKIQKLVKECLTLAGKLSVGDMLGPFKVLDFSGNGKKLVSALNYFDQLVEKIMKEHEEDKVNNNNNDGAQGQKVMDLMDILLEIYRDTKAELKLSKNDIKSFLLVSFLKLLLSNS